ncbi:autotransporter assembly complex protein TamA [Lampropedia cohaerens]|uniref:autotransporter assembly complex protein TamA n=1 Tax=Lampropedia cohaerens TaxID=1610491 RepID=UPI000A07C764|nr:BamA/TamA family outer membrane protein [Lampropedia cohaerens]
MIRPIAFSFPGLKPAAHVATARWCAAPRQRWRGRGALALACVTLGLQGCAGLGGADAADSAQEDPSGIVVTQADPSFDIDVRSDDGGIASHLERHLTLQRYTRFPDLRETEFNRLLAEADENARDLLAALGYFNPTLSLRVEQAQAGVQPPRTIVIEVEPGPQTTVAERTVAFAEPMNSDARAAGQRERIVSGWSLTTGSGFTQSDWDSAKSRGLRELQKLRYPTAQIAQSQASVRAEDNTASLYVLYDAGPLYRFGDLQLEGVQRYDPQGVRNIARIPEGQEYSEEALLDAQQRLAASGYFDSAFLMLDTQSDPDHATVIARVREAKYQKVVFGVGLTTDAGPRLSIDHTHNKLWPLGWRAVSRLALDQHTQEASTLWTAMPNREGWSWFTGGELGRSEIGDFKANSVSVVGGRSKQVGHIDRRYYLQYDFSKVEGGDAPGSSSSIMANYAWTGRYFNNRNNPTEGFGIGAEGGIGFTLTPQREPFLRTHLRGLYLLPVGAANEVGRRSRIALRSDVGAIWADDGTEVPATLLFLTGGDTTVRGYGYESIGSRSESGRLYGGRYLGVGSVEWQRPMTMFGNQTDWEYALFVDTGFVSNDIDAVSLYTGVGTGIRWNSPVGPMQADVAYGIDKEQLRLHLRLGFTF